MNTKEKIIETAIRVFNERGFGPVSIQDIANELGVNRRNIAYHFNSKDELLAAIADELWAGLEKERQRRRDFPSFENLTNETKMYYAFQKKYTFIFNDLNVIRHPLMAKNFRQLCMQTIKDNEAAIAFAIKLGNMKPEPFPGAYSNLSLAIWVLALFWRSQQVIRQVNESQEGPKVIWSLILPHFTEKGIASFKAFFGEEFYNSIGDPFEVDLGHAFF